MKNILLMAGLCAAPALAGTEANCKPFMTAMDKAAKAAGGGASDADGKKIFHDECLKQTDADVLKTTKCLNAVKTKDDFNKCFK